MLIYTSRRQTRREDKKQMVVSRLRRCSTVENPGIRRHPIIGMKLHREKNTPLSVYVKGVGGWGG